MIPCRICGKDASTGWVQGFSPAPDSQKMALCSEHDTPKNRLMVINAWQEAQKEAIGLSTRLAAHKAAPDTKLLSVRFTGGGFLTFTCVDCEATPQGSLRIDEADGKRTFIPLQHVRAYSLSPLPAATDGGKTALPVTGGSPALGQNS